MYTNEARGDHVGGDPEKMAPASVALFRILQRIEVVLRAWLLNARSFVGHARPKAARSWGTAVERLERLLVETKYRFATGRSRAPRRTFDRLSWKRWIVPALGLPLFVLLAGLSYVAYCAFTIPLEGGLAPDPFPSALVIEAADDSVIATRGNFRGEKLSSEDMPESLMKAIVAIEDRRFYRHSGLDVWGIGRALWRDVTSRRAREGASTITQQLARLMFLSPDRNLRRKVQEALIAIWLERQITKREILVRYLNSAYFGAGAFGADGASRRYFGKTARGLTLAEAAMLAGLVRAPSQLSPSRDMDAARQRSDLVLAAMKETGAATQEQITAAHAHPAELKVSPELSPGYGYVADLASSDVKELVGLGPTDLTVETTIDGELQSLAERSVAKWLDAEGVAKQVSQGALVALRPDGAIVSLVGGRNYAGSQFNRATQAKRQAGSLFKLFVYMTALRHGLTPDTTVVDRPIRIGNWEPQNFENRYRGPIPARTAFAESINTVAASLADQVGIKNVIATAHELGVSSDLPELPSLALGTAGVTLLEMTRAFATVAMDQDSVKPFLIGSIKGHAGTLFTRPPNYPTGDPEPAKAAMRDLLLSVVQEGTGRGARLSNDVGGKTGTSQNFRDAWFIGFTSDLVVGVWVGNDDNTPMNRVTGGDLPVKIWRNYVAEAEKIMKVRQTSSAKPSAEARLPSKDATPGATAAASVEGSPSVADTSTLIIDGRAIRLAGVAPEGGRAARALARYLRRSHVTCTRTAVPGAYACELNGQDIAMTVLSNGGAATAADASPEQQAAAESARASRLGRWR